MTDLQVAENKCWSCGQAFAGNSELCSHLHVAEVSQLEGKVPWAEDSYLRPFMEDDSLLHSLSIFDDDEEEDCGMPVERGECSAGDGKSAGPQGNGLSTVIDDCSDISARFQKAVSTGGDKNGSLLEEQTDRQLKITRASVTAKEIKKVDDNYFGSYSSFGIHREMLGDKVRELLSYVINRFLQHMRVALISHMGYHDRQDQLTLPLSPTF